MKYVPRILLVVAIGLLSCNKSDPAPTPTPTPTPTPVPVEKDYVSISDAGFRTYLLSEFDTDNDGGISDAEALAVKDIDCSSLGISSLSGIRCFTNLETLKCSDNGLTSLVLCSASSKANVPEGNCSKLEAIDCSGNKVALIDISACSGLEYLDASNNELEQIDLSKNTSLQELDLSDNRLTELNLSKNSDLKHVSCTGNGNLVKVIIPEGSEVVVNADEGVEILEDITIISVTGISLSSKTLSLTEGDKETLSATVTPDNATDKSVSWASDNAAVASVNASGEVTAVKEGTATITATSTDGGKTASCSVTVSAKTIHVTSVRVTPASMSMVEGTDSTLTVTVLPENAVDRSVTWSSSNTGVATVDPITGKVSALSKGTAVIKAKTTDRGLEAQCSVSVTTSDGYGTIDDWNNKDI